MRPASRLAVVLLLAAPARAATTYAVGPSRMHRSPCALVAAVTLQPGDIVEVDPGVYDDACQLRDSGAVGSPITLRGVPGAARPVFDATGLDLSGAGSVPRAVFQFTGGSHWQVQHLELKNARNTSLNGAAFRLTAGALDVLIDDVVVHDCQDGFMMDGPATLTVQNSDVFHNGAGDGYSHNFYVAGQSIVLIGNHIHDSNGGQNVKVRSHDAFIAYNLIENAGNYEIDLIQDPPQTDAANANAILLGNLIVRPASSANNSQVIVWGSDNPAQAGRNGSLYAISNTFVLAHSSNRLFHAIAPASGSRIHLVNSIVHATVSGTGLATDPASAGLLSGSNDWITTGITSAGALTAVLNGTNPGFVSTTDLHLAPGAPVLGAGESAITAVDGKGNPVNGVPVQEFAAPRGTGPRAPDSALDLGAFGLPRGTDGGTPDAGPSHAGAPAGGDAGPGAGVSSGTPLGGDVTGSCSTAAGGLPWLGLVALVALGARRLRVNSRGSARRSS